LFELFEDAHKFKVTSQELRQKALVSAPNEKLALNNEAASFENEYVLKMMEASLIKAKLNESRFIKNRILISELLVKFSDNIPLRDQLYNLNSEAEHLFKIGKELREEAFAQLSVSAKYGAMTNAEEQELYAVKNNMKHLNLLK